MIKLPDHNSRLWSRRMSRRKVLKLAAAASGLEGVGYSINRDGPDVRCYGTAESWDDRKTVNGRTYAECIAAN